MIHSVCFECNGEKYALLQPGPDHQDFALVWMLSPSTDVLLVEGCGHQLAQTVIDLVAGRIDHAGLYTHRADPDAEEREWADD